MPYILTIPELCERYMEWTADVAVQILALEAMGAIGINIGAPSFEPIPCFDHPVRDR